MREAWTLFGWLVGIAVAGVVAVVLVVWVHRYVLAPLPYTDPEPPGSVVPGTTAPIMPVQDLVVGIGLVRCRRLGGRGVGCRV